ncbi:mutS protein homolog 4 [Caerostris extrusa]|uniref:MutS protein homolog 4 n=1 Tax=Caerostris extrusa TaxID=172846 RepID=A0AAV4XVV5_CAEEX|nr:mutS protein homolog 4 [Caerostris extrusa]
MACIDIKNPVLLLSQFADTQAYLRLAVQLNVLKPLEIVMPNTSVEHGFKNKVNIYYYCLAACAALLKYFEFKQNVTYATNSLKIVYCTSADTTMISKAEHCLYGVLNHTQTPGGDRLLRANILQPPCDLNTISTRLDCISELIEKKNYSMTLNLLLENLWIQNICCHYAFRFQKRKMFAISCKLLPAGKELPPIFLKVNKCKNFITCTTEDVIKLNDRIQESLNEIYLMSDLYFLLSLAHVCTLSDHGKN